MNEQDRRGTRAGFLAVHRASRRTAAPSTPTPRTRAKMPSTPWRFWAIVTFASGALLSWAVSQSAGTATIVVRTVLGGLFGLAIGMYVVESIWQRRVRARGEPPGSPAGHRR